MIVAGLAPSSPSKRETDMGDHLPPRLRALLHEADRLERDFGDATLAKMNRRFDRQFALSERRAANVVAAGVIIFTVACIAAVVSLRLIGNWP